MVAAELLLSWLLGIFQNWFFLPGLANFRLGFSRRVIDLEGKLNSFQAGLQLALAVSHGAKLSG